MNWDELINHEGEYVVISGHLTSYKIINIYSLRLGSNLITNSSRFYQVYSDALDLAKSLVSDNYRTVICKVEINRNHLAQLRIVGRF